MHTEMQMVAAMQLPLSMKCRWLQDSDTTHSAQQGSDFDA